MVELYAVMVQRGLRTIDQVPTRYRKVKRKTTTNNINE